jgi:hypothetical protein
MGYIDKTGEFVIPLKFTKRTLPEYLPFHTLGKPSIKDFHDGRAFIQDESGKYFVINRLGEPVTEAIYDEAKSFSNGRAVVRVNDLWGVIDLDGRWVCEPKYFSISQYKNNLAKFEIDDPLHRPTIYIALDGSITSSSLSMNLPSLFNRLSSSDITTTMILDRHKGYGPYNFHTWLQIFDRDLFSPKFEFDDHPNFCNKHNPLVGFVSGIPCQFAEAGSFADNRAPVQLMDTGIYTDQRGETAIPAAFQYASPLKDFWIYIDQRGEIAIPAAYQYASPFDHGVAAVRPLPRWGYINREGEVVWESEEEGATTGKPDGINWDGPTGESVPERLFGEGVLPTQQYSEFSKIFSK